MRPSPPSGTKFKLKKRLSAVKLHPDVDRTIDNQGVAVHIAAGEVIILEGQKRVSGMRNVIWNGELYALFEQDLLDTAELLID
jgi:hypothetical protein